VEKGLPTAADFAARPKNKFPCQILPPTPVSLDEPHGRLRGNQALSLEIRKYFAVSTASTALLPSNGWLPEGTPTMPGKRFTLIAQDRTLALAVQGHLHEALGEPVLLGELAGLRDRLEKDAPGVLLLAAETPEDFEQGLRLAEEMLRQPGPSPIVLVERDAGEEGPGRTEPGADAARLGWPRDALALVRRIREFLQSPQADTPPSPVAEIERRLLEQTPSLYPLVEGLALAAAHDVTVLLTGETGTGKTFLARLIHECSSRRGHRFLQVPCGALSANLVESEFFGHVRGAFTGADRPKVGKFAAAGEGTLLLDEIDTLGLDLQAKLLRVIETGEYEPVGSNETRYSTARLIVASNWNLELAVDQGRFRRDLYYRLNVMPFHLPPLRERVRDIAPLVRGMAARYGRKFGKDWPAELFRVCPQALDALEAFPWPGNIRQLENVVQQAVLVAAGPVLSLEHLPGAVRDHALRAGSGRPSEAESLQEQQEAGEKRLIQKALTDSGYNRTVAARALGISKVTLYRKLKKYGLMGLPLRPDPAS
jgi:DNA-binding NtrC family response regulator